MEGLYNTTLASCIASEDDILYDPGDSQDLERSETSLHCVRDSINIETYRTVNLDISNTSSCGSCRHT
ncbi:unnamed protein product [Cylindrotheca closterium]|uniref:Uncharacterized protein n=1 Tax=Cylindrotheca closterium TaxID=2856 RepID=A0AAD2G9R7_9STRA|nr:unnamed protein product [Cylindrotheca closterium]